MCLFPVAGAAVGSRPAYLKHTQELVEIDTTQILTEISFPIPTNLPDRAGTVDGCADARLDVVVVTLVLVLFLAPHQVSI